MPDFAARAGDVLTNQLPRIAQRAERSVLKVLFTAARSDAGAPDDEIRQAASAMRRAPNDALADFALAADDARQLNDAARAAFYRRGSAREAADLQLRAFGANPTDPEVVGNLAFLRLKQQPAQAESVRQLALHALTLPDARFPSGRLEDWTTFAIASALAGRERDARNAWWVTAVLARTCSGSAGPRPTRMHCTASGCVRRSSRCCSGCTQPAASRARRSAAGRRTGRSARIARAIDDLPQLGR